jgi:hypothetical protein
VLAAVQLLMANSVSCIENFRSLMYINVLSPADNDKWNFVWRGKESSGRLYLFMQAILLTPCQFRTNGNKSG